MTEMRTRASQRQSQTGRDADKDRLAMSRAGNTNNIKVFSKQTSSQGPVLNDDRIRIVACTENDHN